MHKYIHTRWPSHKGTTTGYPGVTSNQSVFLKFNDGDTFPIAVYFLLLIYRFTGAFTNFW